VPENNDAVFSGKDQHDRDVESVAAELVAGLGGTEGGTLRFRELTAIMERLEETKWVNPHLPIGWPVMPRGLFPKLSAYSKKIVRIALRWYINPLVDQQNKFNSTAADELTMLAREIVAMQAASEEPPTETRRD